MIQGPKQEKKYDELLSKIYNNFNIYFSINSKSRSGMIITKEYKDVITGKEYNLNEVVLNC